MPVRLFHVALAVTLTGLLALPACNKKDGNGSGSDKDSVRQSTTNLKQIGYAMHAYADANNGFPRGIYGPDGKTLGLSWRVALLPYVEQQSLYKQFRLNEPWDSEHNKQLISKMPAVYAPPGKSNADGRTYYCAFEGKDALMQPLFGPGTPGQHARGLSVNNILDGTSNTLMVVEAGEPVIWTKPEDILFDAARPVPKLGGLFPDVTNVVLCDGSINFINRNKPENVVKAVITPTGGEVIASEFFDK